jgi:cytochrome c-type biogenesis protein CcmH/NrfF
MRSLSSSRANRVRILAVLCIGVFLLGASDDSSRLDRLGHRMMCVCSCGQILMECNHVGCTYSDTMRHELASAIDGGKSDDAILAEFIDKYGTTVLAAPTHTGFDRVAWLLPYLLFIVGVGGFVCIVQLWRKRPATAPGVAASGLSSDELSRLREQARKETEL